MPKLVPAPIETLANPVGKFRSPLTVNPVRLPFDAGQVEGLAIGEAQASAADRAADEVPRAGVAVEREVIAGVIDSAGHVDRAGVVGEIADAASGVKRAAEVECRSR